MPLIHIGFWPSLFGPYINIDFKDRQWLISSSVQNIFGFGGVTGLGGVAGFYGVFTRD